MLILEKYFWRKNLIFKKTGYKQDKQLDHASKRPVLIIAENDEYIYYLKISSNLGVSLTSVKLFNKHGQSKKCFVCVDQIYKKPICFIKELQILEKKNMLRIYLTLKRYQETIDKDEYYDEIKEMVYKMIEEYNTKTKKLKIK